MQKGLMIALVAASIIAIAAIVGVIGLVPSQQDRGNYDHTLPPTMTGRNLTLNLNENLGLKGNAR
ncbi:MAG TPA: hypothetical protein VF016_10275 [Nitrososphaera sp.]